MLALAAFSFHFFAGYQFSNCDFISGLGALKKWRLERGWDPNNPTRRIVAVEACEHIVVLNKRDLVPEWGMEVKFEPFR
jgi:hypothetical protein